MVLPNAGQTKFGLYSSPDEGALLTSGYCDAATGICTLAVPKRELPPGDTLYWKELVAPDGYGLNDEWRTVSKDGVADVIEVVNLPTGEAAAGKIQIIKIDKETGLPLAGVKFQLFKDQDCLIPAGNVMETPADGVLVFENLYPERCYWLKEIAVPEGYLPLQTPLEVTAEREVTLIRIENDRAPVIPSPPEDPGTPGVPGLPSGSQGSGSSGGTAAGGHKAQDHSDSGPGVYQEAAAPPLSPQEFPVPSAAIDPLPDYGAWSSRREPGTAWRAFLPLAAGGGESLDPSVPGLRNRTCRMLYSLDERKAGKRQEVNNFKK